MKRFHPLPFLALVALLGACAQPTPPATAQPASLTITSHENADVITGSRDISVVAALSDASPTAEISAELNGTIVAATRSGDTVTVAVTLADHDNTVAITVANPEQDAPARAEVELNYPFLRLADAQEAAVVIGQADFETTTETDPTKQFDSIYGRPAIAGEVLYLPDYGAGRVMGYNQVPTSPGAAADFVLGQPDFDTDSSPRSATTFSGPQTVDTHGERWLVTDYDWNRVLVYDHLPVATGAAASHVIGQADFTSYSAACSATRLDSPESAVVVDGKLIVADGGNHRVLIWNSVPTAIDTPADLVLGQDRMDTCSSNDDDQDGVTDTPTARTLDWPSDVWSDGTRLVVADVDNNRVLIWNTFPSANFVPADVVLGQPDFTSNGANLSASAVDYPYMLHSNGNQLFVADENNNRVLIWNEFPAETAQAADVVLGQIDMDSGLPDAGGSVSASGLNAPSGVFASGNQLFVADRRNNRYLVFEGSTP